MVQLAAEIGDVVRTASGRVVTTPNSRFVVKADWVRFWFMMIATALSTIIVLMCVE